ncbi:MAG: hypothetical protein ACO38W_03120 [Phycisphaerales bacterium]
MAVIASLLSGAASTLAAGVQAADRDQASESPEAGRLSLRGLGVSLTPPPGTIWTVRLREDGAPRAFLAEPTETPRWTMTIEPFEATDRGDLPSEAIDEAIDYLDALREDGVRFQTRVNRPFEVDGRTGHLLLVEVPLDASNGGGSSPDEADPTGVTGFLVLPRAGREFVAFRVVAESASLPQVLPLLERSFASIRVEPPETLVFWESDVLESGRQRLARFSPEKLLGAADGAERWHRLRRISADGATIEVGAFMVRAVPAPRGLLDPARDPASLRASEQEPGVLVAIEARMLPPETPPGEQPTWLDVSLRAWLALDRSSESWSMRRTIRGDRREPSVAETGVRLSPSAGPPRPVLEVIEASREAMSREPRRWTLPDEPFLSQVEAVLMGPLLAAGAREPGEFAWRTYDRTLGDVTRRLEVLVPLQDSGGCEVRTLTHPDDPAPMVQRFDAEGRLRERRDPDGTITEAIELEALRRLWRSKGLPLE